MRHVLTNTICRARALALLLTICVAGAAFGWGDESHRAIARGAAVILPDEIRPFFLVNSDFIAQHSTDPDYIPNRTQAQKAEHFLDLDNYLLQSSAGSPPFKGLPHDRAKLEKTFGAAFVAERGLLPWTVNREFERLVQAFKDKDWAEARLAAAFLSHFVADATMPLHATVNYDGQLTGNNGIHRRIELEMVGRFHNVAMVAPSAITEVGDPVEWTFKEIERSLTLCPAFLKADTDARQAAPLDTEAYYLKLNEAAGPIVDARTRDAANALAGFWLAAWQKAGRPALPPQRDVIVLVYGEPPESYISSKYPPYMPEPEIAKIAAACASFDAFSAVHAGGERGAPRQSLHFLSALDASAGLWRWFAGVEDLGRPSEAIDTISRSFAQFPSAQHTLILLCYGWKDDAALPAAIAHLKATKAQCCVFTIGKFAVIPAVKQFAADSGAAFHDLGESPDVPALVAKEVQPLLAPTSTR